MSWKVGANFRPPAEKLHLPRLTMDWAVPMNGRSDKSGIDEWKGRCNLPPAGGKVVPPAFNDEWAFPFNGRSENENAHEMGTPLH